MRKNTQTENAFLELEEFRDVETIVIETQTRTFTIIREFGDKLVETPKTFDFIQYTPDGRTKITIIPKRQVIYITVVFKKKQETT